mgnify:CR=1 FL=1
MGNFYKSSSYLVPLYYEELYVYAFPGFPDIFYQLLHQLVAGMELCVFCRAADEAKQEYVCEDGEDQHHKDDEEFFGRKRID